MWNTRGSDWHRWDPHLHAPGTLLSDQFKGDWTAYLAAVENASPPISALGVTDYFCIGTYREVRRRKAAGSLSNVDLIFPNVEIRLDIKTAKNKGINLHLLFSPDDPAHEEEIERILGQLQFEFKDRSYSCMRSQLIELGRTFHQSQIDEHSALRVGANQFKIGLQDLKRLFRTEKWLRENCLVAVAGSANDGTAGLQQDDSFTATRHEIERFAQIIFASTLKQREFWLGKSHLADEAEIRNKYQSLKPCLHGSDSHRNENVGQPDGYRYCWLRGDVTFETLRQAVIEPERRVCIGEAPPVGPIRSEVVEQISVQGAPWITRPVLELNSGLITIIGARGSGKTALMDFLAAAAGAMSTIPSDSSFLQRALRPVNLLHGTGVELVWGDADRSGITLGDGLEISIERPLVRYLSQQFVEQLCSSAGLAVELRCEMERVVFESTEAVNRLETDSFEELANAMLEPIHIRRDELKDSISNIGLEIVREDVLSAELQSRRRAIELAIKKIADLRLELVKLLPKDKEAHIKKLTELEAACGRVSARVESLRRQRRLIDDLLGETDQLRHFREPTRFDGMVTRFSGVGLSREEWEMFRMNFVGDVDSVLRQAQARVDRAIRLTTEGNSEQADSAIASTRPDDWPLRRVERERDQAKKEVGIDEVRQKKYTELAQAINTQEVSLRRMQTEYAHAEGAPERRRLLIERRRREYHEIFQTVVHEEQILHQLYSPLKKRLQSAAGTLSKLAFVIRRNVGLDSWVKKGENLLDLRKESALRGQGTLKEQAKKYLVKSWTSGTPEQVDEAMDQFRTTYQQDILKSRPTFETPEKNRGWGQSVAAWLYDTSHITVEYGILYDGTAIEQLSPGARGIVLLLLYLAVDIHDRRPLLIDQPEENLDPQSVFEELIPHFRAARDRRQIVIVTHNANLVVNTDADQVIVASSERGAEGGLPRITYRSGSLENPEIRSSVCQLLEGGKRAFMERERRYRLRWGDPEERGSDFDSRHVAHP